MFNVKSSIMKKTGILMLALTFITSVMFTKGTPVKAYGSSTHPWLTTRGVALIKNDNSTISKLLSTTINGQKAGNILINNANTPDNLSSELYPLGQNPSLSNYAAPHFYDPRTCIKDIETGVIYPRTGVNYVKSTDTANSRLETHYNNAVSLYKSGNKATAYKELGMALHFLQDLCTPHHAVNATALNSNHTSYENWINANAANKSAYAELSITPETYDLVKFNSIIYIGYDMALGSVDSAQYVVAASETAYVKTNYAATASKDLKRAQRITAGVIYKFYLDVGAVK